MFKIKNFTGNGIKINGNVKIDKDGIANNFIINKDYIITNLNITDLQLPFEFQIKFKVSNTDAFKELHLISNKTYAYPYFELVIVKNTISLNSFVGQAYNMYKLFKGTFNFNENSWYILNMKHEQQGIYACVILDDYYNQLYNKIQNSGYEINYHSDTIILGNDVNYVSGSATLQIDLSETYFKNGDSIISNWNL